MSESKKINFYIDSAWDFKPPVARIWLDNYLISERAVTPKRQEGNYLDEEVTLKLESGKYKIVVENVKNALSELQLHTILVDGKPLLFKTEDNVKYEAILEVNNVTD